MYNDSNQNPENKGRETGRTQMSSPWARVIWFVVLAFLVMYFFKQFVADQPLELSYTKFKGHIGQGNVSEATIKGNSVEGVFKEPIKKDAPGKKGETPDFKKFETAIPSFGDEDLLGLLENKNVNVTVRPEDTSWLRMVLIGFLPWVLLLGFIIYSSKKFQERMGGGRAGPFGFGKSKARLYTKSRVDIGFDDVAGLANTKKELQEVVDFLKDPSRYKSLGGELPKGILLIGPPGTGKTLMARATAGEADVPFFSISGSEFIEMFVGVGASRVRDMFNRAKKESPAIIFVDELDAIGRVRGTGLGGGHDEREQTLNQILSEMDGFSPQESVVVISATNRPDVLDPALVRPGRFDRQISLELPRKNARKQILQVHTKNVPLADDIDLEDLAHRAAGLSGADLKNLVNEAVLLAARQKKKQVDANDFEQARDKMLMGTKREEVIDEEEKRGVAYHEAGHALMAKLLPGADPLKKVSIIPRGRSLGATEQTPEEDRHKVSRRYLMDRLAIMLGGRAAEKIVFDDITSGAGDDLKKSTQLARRMVCQWGMSEKLGPVTFRQGEPHPFLGREISEQRDFSEETARLIDEEVRALITKMEKKAHDTLTPNRKKLDSLAQALMKHETLSNEEIDDLLGFKSNQQT